MMLRAKQRLIAFQHNGVGPDDLSKEFTEFYDRLNHPRKDSSKIGSVGELSIWFSAEVDAIYLLTRTNDLVSFVDFDRHSPYTIVRMSCVEPDYLGQGLGMLMYEAALKKFGNLASSTGLSLGSSELWKRMIEKYRGCLVIPKRFSPSGSELRLKIHGWTKDNGVVFPLLMTQDKRLVSLEKIRKMASQKKKDSLEKIAADESFYLVTL